MQREMGMVTRKSTKEKVVMICAHSPALSSAFPRISVRHQLKIVQCPYI